MNDQKFNPLTEGYTEVKSPTVKKKTSGATIFMLMAITALLGTGIYLFADNTNKGNNIVALNTKVIESETRYTDLDSKYTATLAELESYKGKNAELDSMLSKQENIVIGLQANLAKEKKLRHMSDADYKKHLDELAVIVTDLNQKVDALQKENVTLGVQKDSLTRVINVTNVAYNDLKTVNTELNTKVTIASLLIPQNFAASGTFMRGSGKEIVTYKANKTDQLRVCFTVPENKVAEKGSKTYFVRIVDADGKVLMDESKGSGVFNTVVNSEQKEFTFASTFDYAQTTKDMCMHWTQKGGLTSGTYTAEVYQDGYLISNQKFELK